LNGISCLIIKDKSFIILDMMNIFDKWYYLFTWICCFINSTLNSNKYSSAEIFKRFANMGLICPKFLEWNYLANTTLHRCKTSLNIREEQIFQLIDKFNCLKICSILPFASNQVSAFVDSDHVNFVLIHQIYLQHTLALENLFLYYQKRHDHTQTLL
jgi:hypothetical protein